MDSEWKLSGRMWTEEVWFLGWTPDRDSQFDDELMRVEAQSRWQSWQSMEGFKGVLECGRVGSGRLEIGRVE